VAYSIPSLRWQDIVRCVCFTPDPLSFLSSLLPLSCNSFLSLTPTAAVHPSVREKQLEEKVSKLQDELTASYRLSNEHGMTLLRLKAQAEADEKLVLQKEELYAELHRCTHFLRALCIALITCGGVSVVCVA
jgi:hypothetical protein